MEIIHDPVLLDEVIYYLQPKPGGKYIDGTLGGGGHTLKILEASDPDGQVMGMDLDPNAISTVLKKIKIKIKIKNKKRVILVQDNFGKIKENANVQGFNKVNGVLLDLGLSSGQLQDQKRGFSFLAEGDLDMRFGAQTEETAESIVNSYSQQNLYEIFKNFGEERLAHPISKIIIEKRKDQLITSPSQLVEIIVGVYRRYFKGQSKTNPATKVFQALRIAVNKEMENLAQVLPDATDLLAPGGRLVIISYHSLEDRQVKEFFRREAKDCICHLDLPICQCNHKKTLRIITKKPVVPIEEEVSRNPRARSAKLRVAEKI